jgi:glycine dehydrogenase
MPPARDPPLSPARGQAHRNVYLIPSSAHGTNPASASVAGCGSSSWPAGAGDIDLDDLRAKVAELPAILQR